MDLLDIVRACLRRWYVFVPVLALTGYLAAGQYQAAEPQYTASTSVLVAPSRDLIVARGEQSGGGDPVTTPFNGNNGASSLAGMLRSALNTSTVRSQLVPEGGVALLATRDTEEDSALVSISVVSNSRERTEAAVAAVDAGANGVLAGLQTAAGAPGNQMYATVPGGPSDAAREDYPDRLRAVVGLGLAGTLLAVVLSVLVQAVARSRRGKRPSRPKLPRQPRQRSTPPASTHHTGRPAQVDIRGKRTGTHV